MLLLYVGLIDGVAWYIFFCITMEILSCLALLLTTFTPRGEKNGEAGIEPQQVAACMP